MRLAVVAVVVFASLAAAPAGAARVAVLSNNKAEFVANDFASRFPQHTFTAFNVSAGPPDLAVLTGYDEILLFEDTIFDAAPAVGERVWQFATGGRPVILSTFYEQDRSDRAGLVLNPPHGWGPLETIDPNTTDTIGAASTPRSLDPASIVAHPLTRGLAALSIVANYAGGNQAKAGTQVLARWAQPNNNGQPDPLIALRIDAATGACVMHVGMAPDIAAYNPAGFSGDYYRIWKNAFDYGGGNCGRGWVVPALSALPLAALMLLLAALGAFATKRRTARQRR